MVYRTPVIADFGSITQHTFANAPASCNPNKQGTETGIRDKKCEFSHTSGVDQCLCDCCPTAPGCSQSGTCPGG